MPLQARARIAIVGEFDPTNPAHQAISLALALAAEALGGAVEHEWIASDTLAQNAAERLATYSGIWCIAPYGSTDGALEATRLARETGRACLESQDKQAPELDALRGKLNPIIAAFVRAAQEQQA